MKPNLVVAGASFPFGPSDFGIIAIKHGFRPVYLEHPQFESSIDDRLSNLVICDEIPSTLLNQPGVYIPVLESWVSEGIKLATSELLSFDHHAAATSRSKTLLSEALSRVGCPSVPRSIVQSETAALAAAATAGYPVILRRDAGYSGRGVCRADSPEQLVSAWQFSLSSHDTDDILDMNRVLALKKPAFVIEPCFDGKEWSIDVVVSERFVVVIRATQKATKIVDGRPISLGYRIVSDEKMLAELTEAAQTWANALFRRTTVSLGSFDIRRDRAGHLVPIDFGTRLGGDELPRFVRAASLGKNPYAAALDAVLADDPARMQPMRSGASMIHVYAEPSTVFHGISVKPPAQVINVRQSEFRVGNSRPRRVASVMMRFDSSDAFFDACEHPTDWCNLNVSAENPKI